MDGPRTLGDMHHAAVAVQELGGEVSAEKVADRLKGVWSSKPMGEVEPDVERAKTALVAAEEHRVLVVER